MPQVTTLGITLTITAVLVAICTALVGVFMADSARQIAYDAQNEARIALAITENMGNRIGVRKKPKESPISLNMLKKVIKDEETEIPSKTSLVSSSIQNVNKTPSQKKDTS